MLFTESQLQMVSNPMALLNEATYLNENEAIIRPQTIPVSENTRIGAYTVRFDDIHRLAENHGIDYVSAMVAVAESAGVDPTYLKVAIDESEIICDPKIITAFAEGSVVVSPLSTSSLAYRYVNECISLWDQMPDTDEADMALAEALINDTYLEQFINEDGSSAQGPSANGNSGGPGLGTRIKNGFDAAKNAVAGKIGDAKSELGAFGNDLKAGAQQSGIGGKAAGIGNAIKDHKVAAGATAAAAIGGTAAIIAGAKKLLSVKDQPKSFIGQKIAALRKVYQGWMQKAEKGGPGVGAKLKQAAAKLLTIIDALMAKMQKMAG